MVRYLRFTVCLISALMSFSCSRPISVVPPAQLTFVIDHVSAGDWSHYDDGSFEVNQTVGARIIEPEKFRGQIVVVPFNPLASGQDVVAQGTTWTVALPDGPLDPAQLAGLIARRIQRSPHD